GTDVDDAPAAARQQVWQRRLGSQQRSAHVDCEHAFPGLDIAAFDLFPLEATGDVDEPIEATEVPGCLVHRRTRSGGIAEIDTAQCECPVSHVWRGTPPADQGDA